jgi:hypothetical protein
VDGELLSPRVGLRLAGSDAHCDELAGPDRPVLDDSVGDVDQSDGREGEIAAGHEGEMEWEGQHVGIGGRERVAQREAAHSVVGGQPVAVRFHVLEDKTPVGHGTSATAHEWEP